MMKKIRTGRMLFALVCCSLSLTAMAHAEDAAPVITSLSATKTLKDSAVDIHGSNFGSDASKVKVSIAGKVCIVNFVSNKIIMILTPSTVKPGKTVLLLTVEGKKANAMAIEILDRKGLSKDFWKKETERVEVSERKKIETENSELLLLERLETKAHSDGRYVIEIAGSAKELIDDCRVQVHLSFFGKFIGRKYITVKDNKFQCQFGPFDKELFPGIYEINIYFLLHRQRYVVRHEWRKVKSKDKSRQLAKLKSRSYYKIGTEAEAKDMAKSALEKHRILYETLSSQLQDLQDCYASSTRCFFKKGKKLNERYWKQWLEGYRFVKTAADWERIKKDRRCVKKSNHLDAKKWEEYIAQNLTSLRAQYFELQRAEEKYLASRYPIISGHLQEMFTVLLDLYLGRTRVLYEQNRLNIPKDLVSQLGAMPFGSNPFSSVGRFVTLQRKIKRCMAEAAKILDGANDSPDSEELPKKEK
jgi:hypothetical protein